MKSRRPARPKPQAKQKEDDFLLRLQKMPKAVRIVYARPRLFISLLIGIASLNMVGIDVTSVTAMIARFVCVGCAKCELRDWRE